VKFISGLDTVAGAGCVAPGFLSPFPHVFLNSSSGGYSYLVFCMPYWKQRLLHAKESRPHQFAANTVP